MGNVDGLNDGDIRENQLRVISLHGNLEKSAKSESKIFLLMRVQFNEGLNFIRSSSMVFPSIYWVNLSVGVRI